MSASDREYDELLAIVSADDDPEVMVANILSDGWIRDRSDWCA